MNKRFIPALAAVTIGLFTSAAMAQNYTTWEVRRDNTADPGSAPFASPTGGRPVPVDPAEVRRDNTADPNSAPLASPTGGRPVPVDPAEVIRDNTADPG